MEGEKREETDDELGDGEEPARCNRAGQADRVQPHPPAPRDAGRAQGRPGAAEKAAAAGHRGGGGKPGEGAGGDGHVVELKR